MSIAAILVHVDVERDCEQKVQFALDLAARFEAALIGAAGLPLRPAFAAGGVVIYREPTQDDYAAATTRFEEMGKKFRIQGQHLKHVEWRSALELPADLIVREARAADVILVGPTRSGRNVHDLVEPGAICCGRAGRSWWCRRSLVDSRFVASWSRARMPVDAGARSATRCRFCGRPMKFWLSKSGKKIRNPRTSEIWPTSGVISRATVSLWRMKSGSAPAGRLQPNSWSLSAPRTQT